jgi:membrane protease YdiL (CAAX protease family)
MTFRDIFINEFGRLRSGWRLVIYFAAFIALSFVWVVVLRGLYLAGSRVFPKFPYAEFAADAIFRLTLLLSALGAGFICVKFLEGLPFRSLGLGFHSGFLRDLVVGSAIGILSVALAVLIAVVMGGLRFSLNNEAVVAISKSLIASGGLLFIAALAEEAMFRGYPLQTLSRARLAWLGALLTSVPFGLVHLNNPNVIPGVTFANTALAGIWLAIAYLKTRSLWFPWGVHWAWNFALGGLFGLPISGINLISHPLLKAEDIGPRWLTAASYGIEGGIACTIALIVSTLLIWFLPWPSATPELKQMTSEEQKHL